MNFPKKFALAVIFIIPLLIIPILNNCLYLGYWLCGVDYIDINKETTLNELIDTNNYNQYILKDSAYFNECNMVQQSILLQYGGEYSFRDKIEAGHLARTQVNESGMFNLSEENSAILNTTLKPINKMRGLKLVREREKLEAVGFAELKSSNNDYGNQINSIMFFERNDKFYVLIKKDPETNSQYCVFEQTTNNGFELSELEEWDEQDEYLNMIDIDSFDTFFNRHFYQHVSIGTGVIAAIPYLIKLLYIIEYVIILFLSFAIVKLLRKKKQL